MKYLNPSKPGGSPGLFSVATQVAATDPAIGWAPNFGWGVQYALPSGTVTQCGSPAICEPKQPGQDTFYAFAIDQTAGCIGGAARAGSSLGETGEAADEWMRLNEEGWIERTLEAGSGVGPVLSIDTADAGASTTIQRGAALLLRNRRNLGMFDRPILWVPEWASPFVSDTEGAGIHRAMDVVYGSGIGTDPSVHFGNQAFNIYLTGPVEYAKGRPERGQSSGPNASAPQLRQNLNWELTTELAIFRWAKAGTFRTLVTIT